MAACTGTAALGGPLTLFSLVEFVSLSTNFLVRWRDCKFLMSLLLAIKSWITAYFVSQALIHHPLFPSIVVAVAPSTILPVRFLVDTLLVSFASFLAGTRSL